MIYILQLKKLRQNQIYSLYTLESYLKPCLRALPFNHYTKLSLYVEPNAI